MLVFGIIMSVVIVCLALLLMSLRSETQKKMPCKIVKAGEISKISGLMATINNIDNKNFMYQGKPLNVNEFTLFVVDGESMASENIHTGNGLLVKPFNYEQKKEITGNPLLVFEIDNNRKYHRNPDCDASAETEYKLRKFVGYFNRSDSFESLQKMFDQYGGSACYLKEKQDNALRFYPDVPLFILSYTNKDGQVSPSIHPIAYVYGKVEFIIPKEALLFN